MKPETVEDDADNPLLPGRLAATSDRGRRPLLTVAPPAGRAAPATAPGRETDAAAPLLKSALMLVAVLTLVSLGHNLWQGWHGSWVRRARVATPYADWWTKSPAPVDPPPDAVVTDAAPAKAAPELAPVPAMASESAPLPLQRAPASAAEDAAPDPPDPAQGPLLSIAKWRRVYADGTYEEPWVNTYWSGVVALPQPDSTQLALHGPVVAAFVLEENPMEDASLTPAAGAEECTWRCFFDDGFMLSLPPFVEDTWMALDYGAGWAKSPPIEVTASSGKRFHLPMDGAKLREEHGAIRAVATCEWLRTNRVPVEQVLRD